MADIKCSELKEELLEGKTKAASQEERSQEWKIFQ